MQTAPLQQPAVPDAAGAEEHWAAPQPPLLMPQGAAQKGAAAAAGGLRQCTGATFRAHSAAIDARAREQCPAEPGGLSAAIDEKTRSSSLAAQVVVRMLATASP